MMEYYHSIGELPDRYYYQMNRRTATENYRESKKKILKKMRKSKSLEDFVINLLRATLEATLKEIMDDIIP